MLRPRSASGTALLVLCLAGAVVAPLAARDSLGMFSSWGAFRDPEVPRCYTIAKPQGDRSARDAFASVSTWPRRQVRGQIYFRLSRPVAASAPINLAVGDRRFALAGSGRNAWARDRVMDAGIVAAMRSAGDMTVSARGSDGRGFADRYDLAGAATAMDAATVGCARLR